MEINLKNDLNYDILVEKLIEKSRAGKLKWQETAEEDKFVAAVKGQQTKGKQSLISAKPDKALCSLICLPSRSESHSESTNASTNLSNC